MKENMVTISIVALKNRIAESKLTLEEISEKSQFSNIQLRNLLNGDKRSIDVERAKNLAKVLNVPLNQIIVNVCKKSDKKYYRKPMSDREKRIIYDDYIKATTLNAISKLSYKEIILLFGYIEVLTAGRVKILKKKHHSR